MPHLAALYMLVQHKQRLETDATYVSIPDTGYELVALLAMPGLMEWLRHLEQRSSRAP